MARQIKGGSVEHRILHLLAERYPVTEEEVALALSLRPDVTRLALTRLHRNGLVTLERPGGKTYVALTGAGVQLIGLTAGDVSKARKSRKLPPPPPRPDDDPAFG